MAFGLSNSSLEEMGFGRIRVQIQQEMFVISTNFDDFYFIKL
jgi:hypothetical protein